MQHYTGDDPPHVRLGALTIMAARPRELARFYSRLLNWPYIREEGPRPGEQTSTMHLDLGVDDLDAAVAWAIECGATPAAVQPRPTEHRVMLDPDGHPFCICLG